MNYDRLKSFEEVSGSSFLVFLGITLGTIIGICISIPLYRILF